MATFNVRANGRVTAMIRRTGQKPIFRTFDTRKEAEDWATVTEGRIIARRQAQKAPNGATTAPPPSQISAPHTCTWTLDDGLAWYEERYTGIKRGAAKERTRIAWLRRHKLAQSFMDQVRPADINDFIDGMLAKGRSPTTARNYTTILSQVYVRVAKRVPGLEWLPNPVAGAELPKVPPGRDRRLEPGEYDRLLAAAGLLAAGDDRYALMPAAIEFAVETAMRQGEMLGLRRKDIRTEGGRTYAYLASTKNGKARDVDLSTRARRAIADLLGGHPEGRLFDIPVSTFEKRWQDVLDVARIEGLRFHDLRREGVSRLFERGLTTQEVMRMSGHRTYSALSIYTHIRPGDTLAAKLG